MPKEEKPDPRIEKYGYDPFSARKLTHPTSDMDTLVHLLNTAIGSGLLAMPIGFKYVGLIFGIFGSIFTGFIVIYCIYVLVNSTHELCFRKRRSSLTYPDIAEVAFATGPEAIKKFSKFVRYVVVVSLFASYFGICSVYVVIVSTNFKQVIDYYIQLNSNLRIVMVILLIPLVILTWIPNLKYLAPISMLSNLCMGFGIIIMLYYLFQDLPNPNTRPYIETDVECYPLFISISIFAMEPIGVIIPLENNMEHPTHFLGYFGVLVKGMVIVVGIYLVVGFLGYLRYGDATMGSLTLNLPVNEFAAQGVKLCIASGVFFTYALQFYVCNEILWINVRKYFSKRAFMAHYGIRTILSILAVLLAILIPTIAPFIGLIGALCFSMLGLIIPIVIEIVTFWGYGSGKFYWRLMLNIFCLIFGIFALVFGTAQSIEDIINIYKEDN